MVGDRSMHNLAAAGEDTVSCVICEARYAAASRTQDAAHTLSPLALESALMSMCHFCFCCRRPACPYCWDDAHGVCAQCAQEARLPFRTASPPLSGVLFAPPRKQQVQRVEQTSHPLLCVQPGTIQHAALSIDIVTTRPQISVVTAPGRRVVQSQRHMPFQQAAIQIEQDVSSEIDAEEEEDVQGAQIPQKGLTAVERIERILTVVLLLVLALIVALILVAVYSADANTLIAEVLHIDIRLEMMYLWQMMMSLHW